jgi:hypothetical protein
MLLVWKGPTNALVEIADSGQVVVTDRTRYTRIYKGTYVLCVQSQPARGTFGTGALAGWVVNQSTVTQERGTIGKLSIEWEAGGAYATSPLPIGEPHLEPQELYPKIERNAYFQGSSGISGAPTTPIAYTTIQLAYNALYNSQQAGSSAAWQAGSNLSGDQLLHFNELLAKLQQGEETYYLAGWRYSYELFSYTFPTIFRGAFIQQPGGPFSNVLPAGTSWLRLADNVVPAGVNGSMWKLTLNYVGGPNGHWDPDIYNGK